MRFKSAKTGPYQVLAVSGTNTISFAIAADKVAATKGLLGFAVERSDPEDKRSFYVFGFKVFPSVIPKPTDKTVVKTSQHPMQSFVWDDFTAKPDHKYEYFFHPLGGTPKKLDRSGDPVSIRVQTEPLFSRPTNTTSSSIAASPAARPMRASSATRSPRSSRAPSRRRPWNG